MLVCYLDDSGTDRQNRLVTLAGYIAKEDQWSAFEAEVEPIFGRYGVKVLHTVDLHNTDGEPFRPRRSRELETRSWRYPNRSW